MLNKKIRFVTFFTLICFYLISCVPQNEIIRETKKVKSSENLNKDLPEKLKKKSSFIIKEKVSLVEKKIVKKEIISIVPSKISSKNNVIFEFKNERHLQGLDSKEFQKNSVITEKAIQATFKMLAKNPSTGMESLKFNKNFKIVKNLDYKFNNYVNYVKKVDNAELTKNVLVLLPISGLYKKFGKNIRRSLELSVLETKEKLIQFAYFDTGRDFSDSQLLDTIKTVNPSLILGPLLRENIIKIKSIVSNLMIPIISFNNDNSLSEKYLWITGFSPQKQIKTMIDYSIKCNKTKFGFIGKRNQYGEIILSIVNKQLKERYLKKYLLLDKNTLNKKNTLHKVLKKFLNYKDNKVKNDNISYDLDTIFIIGDTNFILEVMPILTYYDLDTSITDVIGTDILEEKILRIEHSMINTKFPKIRENNKERFRSKWKKLWSNDPDKLSRLGYDMSKIASWLIYQNRSFVNLIKSDKNKFSILGNKYKFLSNGNVERPIEIVKINKLGNLKKIKLCQ